MIPKRFLICATPLLMTGCTLFSPYVPSAKIEREITECQPLKTITSKDVKPVNKKITKKTVTTHTTKFCDISTRALSRKFQERFQGNAASLSRTSNTTVLTIAGLLGVGAYNGITDGGKNQIAALGAGAGTLYGLHTAMYTPTREQLYQRAVKALVCLDEFYSDISPETGENIAKLYRNHPNWPNYQERYDSAYELATFHDNSYRGRVRGVAADLNILLSNAQPAPTESYAKVSSAITGEIADIKVMQSGQHELHPQQMSNIASLFSKLERWVVRVQLADKRINQNNPDSCNLQGAPAIKVLGVEHMGSVTMKVGETSTRPITNASTMLSSAIYPTGPAADKESISSLLVSEGGNFAIRLEAKKKTTKPVTVKITDHGNGGLSAVFSVTVE